MRPLAKCWLRFACDIAGTMVRAPAFGDRMIVTKEPYTSLIYLLKKKMELRNRAIRGEYYLADSTTHKVKAKVKFGEAHELTQEEYQKTFHLHRCEEPQKRYKKTVGTVIESVQPLLEEVPYTAKRGAIGFARFQPFIPKTLKIMKKRKDNEEESHCGANARAVKRKMAKAKELPSVWPQPLKDCRVKKIVSAPVVDEFQCTGSTAIEVAPAVHEGQRQFQVRW